MTKRKKLSAILLGAFLALGVGAGIGASRVETGRAATETFTIALNDNSLGAQAAYAEDQTTASYNGGDATVSLAWGNINPKTGQVRGNQTTQTNLQNAGKFNVRMRNTTALPGNIRSVTLSGISGTYVSASAFVATGSSEITNQTQGGSTAGTNGSSAITWSFTGESGKYFALGAIKGVFSGTVTATSIIVTYETEGGGGDPDPIKVLSMIEILQQPSKKTYNDGDTFDPTGIEVEATFEGEHGDEYEDVTSLVTYSPTAMTLGVTKVTASYTYDGVTKTADITGIVVNASSWATYTEATSIADIHIGATYVIGGIKSSETWVMTTTQNGNNRAAETATMASGKIRETTTIQKFELVEGTKPSTYGFKAINGDTAGQYICAASSSSNYLRSEAALSDNSSFKITFTGGVPTITAQGGYTRNILKFNSTNNPPIFACYGSGQTEVALHVDEDTIPTSSFGTLDSISVDTTDAKTSYFVGENFSSDSLIVTAHDTSGNDQIISTFTVNKSNEYVFVTGDIGTVKITVTGTVNGVSKTADYNVTVTAPRLFAKVEDMSKINTDRIYSLATADGAASTSFASWANEISIDYDETNNVFNEVSNLQTIKLETGSVDGTYALKLLNGSNAGKYYAAVTTKNELALHTEISETSSWTITIDEGKMKIECAVSESETRFIGHNHASTRFAAYTGTSTPAAALYTVTTLDEIAVDAFVTNFMHPEIETTDVGTGECISEGYYAAAKAAFNGMTATQRALFVSDYEAPRARLVAWAIANGDVLNASNILETPVNPAQGGIFNGLDDSNTIMLIVLISLVSVSVLAGAFYLRKREQN